MILIIEGFWGSGKTTLVEALARTGTMEVLREPDHLCEKVVGTVSIWYRRQHLQRFSLAKKLSANGKRVVMERSILASIAFYYARKGVLPRWGSVEIERLTRQKDTKVVVVSTRRRSLILPKDSAVNSEIRKGKDFQRRYERFYRVILMQLVQERLPILYVYTKGGDFFSNGAKMGSDKDYWWN